MFSRPVHRHIARLALVWLLLALGVAAASPVVQPRSMQLVCLGGTVQLVAMDDQGPVDVPQAHQLDCALCLLTGTPPTEAVVSALPVLPRVERARWVSIDAPRVVGAWAPLPARGPPAGVA